jgi:hypothetical protein
MADARTLDIRENPSWVLELPDTDNIAPPVDTLEQELPFGTLNWQNFERLCLKLAATTAMRSITVYTAQTVKNRVVSIFMFVAGLPPNMLLGKANDANHLARVISRDSCQ